MTSLPATLNAAKRWHLLERYFTLPRTWRKIQRGFDLRAAYELSEYYTEWTRGNRYVARPPMVPLNDAVTESANGVYTEQLIRQLSKYHTEIAKWKLGRESMFTSGSGMLQTAEKMPLAQVERYRPVFHTQPPVDKKELNRDAMVESMARSPFTFKLERRESPYSPPGMEKGVYLSGRAVPGQVVAIYPGILYAPGQTGPMLKTESTDFWWRLMVGGGNVIEAANLDLVDLMGLPYHPLAFGQYINHPPEEVHPNLIKFSLTIYEDFPRHLLPLIPVRWYRKPGMILSIASPRVATVFATIFVAARHIYNEELLCEVRMLPGTYPGWYVPYREERNYRSFGMSPAWNDSRDVTIIHDGQSVGSR